MTGPEPTLEEDYDIRRAADAQRLLNDPMMTEAFNSLREKYLEIITRTPVEQGEAGAKTVLEMWHRLDALALFQAELRVSLETGTITQNAIETRLYQHGLLTGEGAQG